ncbi:MAG: response regulator [Lachnospiraceae bacterium]|nr:response regulator [Lachnospiraceae bacterium]
MKKILKALGISEDNSTQLLMFYSMVGIEMLAMLFIMVFQIVMEYETKSILPLFVSVIYLMFVFCFATKYPNKIMLFKVLTLVPMLFFVIPYLYMGTEGGGIKSGMPIWMVLGLLMIFLFTKGIYFVVLFAITLITYIGCIIFSYVYLQEHLGQLEEIYYYQDNILAIVAVSLSCGLVFKYQQRYEERSKKKIEQEKMKAQKANDAKSQFLANMSHDIRTPMNAILGMTEMANYNIDDKEKVQECLKKINDSSVMLLHLINNVLDMSEIESHELKLKEMKFGLKEVVSELYNVLEQNAMSKGLTLEMHSIEIQDNRLVGDVVRLRQVLMNLLSNSIKFTPAGGSVSLVVKQIDSSEQTDGLATFLIGVKDNGIGMKKEFVDTMIFKPFERDETQYVNKTEGNGIGMSITKNILDVMDADFQIDSVLGKGTTFTIKIKFKIDRETEKEEHREDDRIPNLKGKKILIVEDNEINMEIILAILERTQAEIINAWNAEDAIEIYEKSEAGWFDLILMDIQLPGMNGYDATKKIRSLDKKDAAEIPIFAMTANAFSQDVEQSLHSGMNEHISKPIDIEELYQKIQKYLLYDSK